MRRRSIPPNGATNPRFSEQALTTNRRLVEAVADLAQSLELAPAQVALAWVLSRGVVAIPGTRKLERLEENWASQQVALPAQALKRLESLAEHGVVGDRY